MNFWHKIFAQSEGHKNKSGFAEKGKIGRLINVAWGGHFNMDCSGGGVLPYIGLLHMCLPIAPLLTIFPPNLPPSVKAKHLTYPQNFEFSKSDENSPRYSHLTLSPLNWPFSFLPLNWPFGQFHQK